MTNEGASDLVTLSSRLQQIPPADMSMLKDHGFEAMFQGDQQAFYFIEQVLSKRDMEINKQTLETGIQIYAQTARLLSHSNLKMPDGFPLSISVLKSYMWHEGLFTLDLAWNEKKGQTDYTRLVLNLMKMVELSLNVFKNTGLEFQPDPILRRAHGVILRKKSKRIIDGGISYIPLPIPVNYLVFWRQQWYLVPIPKMAKSYFLLLSSSSVLLIEHNT